MLSFIFSSYKHPWGDQVNEASQVRISTSYTLACTLYTLHATISRHIFPACLQKEIEVENLQLKMIACILVANHAV